MHSPLNARIGRAWPSPSLRCRLAMSDDAPASSVPEPRGRSIKSFYVGALLVAGGFWWMGHASTLRSGGDTEVPPMPHDSTDSRDRPLAQTLNCASPAPLSPVID